MEAGIDTSESHPSEAVVRTVLGDVDMSTLGPVDYHEHLFQVSPLLPDDELDDEDASHDEASSLVAAGITSMVEATPTGLGRNPEAVARISRAVGLGVVHVSGTHRREHYREDDWVVSASSRDLVARFEADVTTGLPRDDHGDRGIVARGPDGTPVRAGMLKAGVGYWRIDAFEGRILESVGEVAVRTGVAVMVHVEHGSATSEVLEILDGVGLAPDRVVLAHIDRNLDPGLHAELATRGAYLGYDGMARHREAPDSALVACLQRTIEAGGLRRLLLGGDVARASRYRAYGGMPGLDYLPRRFLPRLRAVVGPAAMETMLRDNPARLLAVRQHGGSRRSV